MDADQMAWILAPASSFEADEVLNIYLHIYITISVYKKLHIQ